MAAQKFGRLIFRGILTVRLEQAPERIGVVPGPAQQATWTLPFRYGTTATPIDTLKIDAPQIRFKCNVTARGTGNVDDWESGILQSISHASWVAQYLNGAQLKYRLDTDHGLVRDGGP